MQTSFDPYFPILLDHEGRVLDTDRRDPGNWTGGEVNVGRLIGTKYGIDASSHWRECDIPNLTELQAKAIYLRAYAAPVMFDRLPLGIDIAVFDAGVNSGVFRAAKWLQEAVGAVVDGWIGPETLGKTDASDHAKMIKLMCYTRLKWLQTLKIWPIFKGGWTTRVEELQIYALNLAAKGN